MDLWKLMFNTSPLTSSKQLCISKLSGRQKTTLKNDIFSTISHLYSKSHNKQSLEGGNLEQVVCWSKFTWSLKFGVNRNFWGVLVRQLMKNNDFFAVFGEKTWRRTCSIGSDCRKGWLIRMKRQRVVICWKSKDCKIKPIPYLHHFALKNWMFDTSPLKCST